MKLFFTITLFSSLVSICFFSCANISKIKSTSENLNDIKFTAEPADDWTALFKREHGWFGADGIFAIPANGVDTFSSNKNNETILLFSDTMIGDIVNDTLQEGYSMIHNSIGILKDNVPAEKNISFHWATNKEGKPETVFIPKVPSAINGDKYWLGDGFINTELDSSLFVFAYNIRDTRTTAWGFAEVANVLIEIPKNSKLPYANYQQTETPFYIKGTSDSANDYGSFGAGIFVNTKSAGAPNADGYVYVYGMQGNKKNVLVARVKPKEFKQFNAWRFWDGNNWNTDILKSVTIANSASNELSVSPLPDGRYAMVFQVKGIGSYVGMRIGKTPYGPFGPVINLWNCDDIRKTSKNFFAYNAKAHPHLSKPGELLISYNVNSFDFDREIKIYPDLYRPRFIKLKFQ